MKSGNLNLLEPSGPLQACNGIALPLPFKLSRNLFILLFFLTSEQLTFSGIQQLDLSPYLPLESITAHIIPLHIEASMRFRLYF